MSVLPPGNRHLWLVPPLTSLATTTHIDMVLPCSHFCFLFVRETRVVLRMMSIQTTNFWNSAAQFFFGSIALALVTLAFFQLGVDLASTAFAYLVVILLCSLMGSFTASALLAIMSIAGLDYFFAPPIFSFRIDDPQHLIVVVAFFLTSLIVTRSIQNARERTQAALQTEANLRRSEAYLAEAQHLSHTGSWAWDVRRQEFVYQSAEVYRLFRLDPKESSGSLRAFQERIVPEDLRRVVEANREAVREKTHFEVDFRIVLPDGSIKRVHSVGHPVLDSDGDVVEIIGTHM